MMSLRRVAERFTPKSIGARLAFGSAILVLAALLVAGISTGVILSRFIRGQVDQRLDTQVNAVAAMLIANALADDVAIADPPPFDRILGGWYWTVAIGGQIHRSASLNGGDIELRRSDSWWGQRGPGHDDRRPSPFNGIGPGGEALYVRVQSVPINGQWATIAASAPAHALIRPLRDALVPVVISMLVLGFLLAVASYMQLRLGLRPLGRLRLSLQSVRAGKTDHINEDQPNELLPLVEELNSLIAQNAEGMKRARGHVSNLGHSLNTPLAALSLLLSASSNSVQDQERLRLVEEMQARIRHHLGRARAAALHGPSYLNTLVAPRLNDVLAVLQKVHMDRALTVHVSVGEDLAVACEPQDLDEMLGNLLENAFKWARQQVLIEGRANGQRIVIEISDDGPGISETAIDKALLAGARLDETVPGHGFGLPITRELAELYQGDIALTRSSSGGLKAVLTLPMSHRA